MLRAGIVLILGTAACAQPAFSQQTSIDLQLKCSGKQSNVGELICQIYFLAFTESLLAAQAAEQNGICFPPGASANQVRAVGERYMATHPEKLHEHASILILNALTEAFPCVKR